MQAFAISSPPPSSVICPSHQQQQPQPEEALPIHHHHHGSIGPSPPQPSLASSATTMSVEHVTASTSPSNAHRTLHAHASSQSVKQNKPVAKIPYLLAAAATTSAAHGCKSPSATNTNNPATGNNNNNNKSNNGARPRKQSKSSSSSSSNTSASGSVCSGGGGSGGGSVNHISKLDADNCARSSCYTSPHSSLNRRSDNNNRHAADHEYDQLVSMLKRKNEKLFNPLLSKSF